MRYRWRVLADNIACATYGSGFLEETRPKGLQDGGAGITQRLTLTRADGTREELETNQFYTLHTGDVFEVISSGGGGCGDPTERDPEKVLRDVRDGVVSLEVAQNIYQVAIDPQSLTLLEAETTSLRNSTH